MTTDVPTDPSTSELRRFTETILRLAKHDSGEGEDLGWALRHISEAAAAALGVAQVGVWLHSPDRATLCCVDLFRSESRVHEAGLELSASDYPEYFRALDEDRTVAAHDAYADPRTAAFAQTYLTPQGIGALLDSPVRRGGVTVGVICHEHVGGPRDWSVAEQVFAGSVADLVAYAIEQFERRRAEAERERLEDQLRQAQKMEAIGCLAGGIAHDFNNLLTVILGGADLLFDDVRDNEHAVNLLNEIRDAGAGAQQLTARLLTFSRQNPHAPKVIDVGEMLEARAPILQRLIGADVKLAIRQGLGEFCVEADPSQLDQVLLNLCANARDAMPGGGTLQISVTGVRALPPELAGQSDNPDADHVLLRVRDTGQGFSDEIRERIFEPFFTTKGESAGTGLGLASVYGIVRQSGGVIDVESEEGHGSCFSIYLPEVDTSPDHSCTGPIATGSALLGTRVLLVEDQPQIRIVIRESLAGFGCTVIEAGSADEALAIAEWPETEIDLLLTDIVMPGRNGWELARDVIRLHPDVAVICMSGFSAQRDRAREELDGRASLLAKPFRPAQLITALCSALAEHAVR